MKQQSAGSPAARDEDIRQLRATLQHLERLLLRYELDTAAGLHAVDYGATIGLLCADFQSQMAALTRGPATDVQKKPSGS